MRHHDFGIPRLAIAAAAISQAIHLVKAAPPADGSCVALQVGDRFVARNPLGGYSTTGTSPSQPFRLQKLAIGTDNFQLYGTDNDFLAKGLEGLGVLQARAAGADTNWRLTASGNGYILTSVATGQKLTVQPPARILRTVAETIGNQVFILVPATGCATAPEAQLNITGTPFTGKVNNEVRGLAELHSHLTAYEFIGGDIHCGEPWSPYGITDALVDCPDHEPNGIGAWWENLAGGGYPGWRHDTTGWPTFKDWPKHDSFTHEAMYYKWLERAWRGGLRLFTNLFVNNEALCKIYPIKSNPCDDMSSIRLQAQRIYELQDFIDAQYGGKGKGWFRIITTPAEARSVIEQGKLAVTLGVEVSQPFGCGIRNGVALCNKADITAGLDELYALGVRRIFVCHKFDNALCGVRFDGGTAGAIINAANFAATGEFWQAQTCPTAAQDNRIEGLTLPLPIELINLLPPGVALPVYPNTTHCNVKGLTPLGEFTIREMMARGILVDVDHMSVKSMNQSLTLLESVGYAGVISSHSWLDRSFYSRIYKLGGMGVPFGHEAERFYNDWKFMKAASDSRYTFGFGAGFDTGGFGKQPAPRGGSRVRYPFQTFDGGSTVERQQTGSRIFDYNVDGLAHYGLVPDWLEDLRITAGADGQAIVNDLSRGAEAYLQVWERVRAP